MRTINVHAFLTPFAGKNHNDFIRPPFQCNTLFAHSDVLVAPGRLSLMQDPLITPTPKLTQWLNENVALEFRFRRSVVVGVALSILFHILLLIFMPERKQKIENEDAASSQPMVVRLNPLQARPPAAAPAQITPPTPVQVAPPRPRILAVPNPVSKSPMAPVPH